ncbi:M23 family metallopeptidase [Microbacterium sp. VKM Ac-2870]|nr:M23 family metallopeptidase [Microbacterium sp. VKM Ac-2870]
MADQLDASQESPEAPTTTPALRSRVRRVALTRSAPEAPVSPVRPRRPRRTGHPIRSLITVAAVGGLIATVAIAPAFAASSGNSAEAVTLQQVAAENKQSLVIASEATPAALARDSYSATTPEEIQSKKDEDAAKAAAAARITAASAASVYSGSLAETIAPAGSVVRPLPFFNHFGEPYPGHKGTDYMVDRYTPINAIADGVVVESSEDGPGWGVYVKIAHNIGGNTVTSLYAHMSYGTRRVVVGDTVRAGQIIGQVGDTGRAFGTHLHLEIYVNGSWTNAEDFLVANVR